MTLDDIHIRTDVKPGDIGYIVHMHGRLYGEEYQYGLTFEAYVAESIAEFALSFNPDREAMWFCEHGSKIIGFISLVDRGNQAQLRYFIIEKAYRGLGLGKKLMELFFDKMHAIGYKSAYLLTSHELPAAASLYARHGFELVEQELNNKFGKEVYLQRYELNQPNQS